jgi:hypothetical protein
MHNLWGDSKHSLYSIAQNKHDKAFAEANAMNGRIGAIENLIFIQW